MNAMHSISIEGAISACYKCRRCLSDASCRDTIKRVEQCRDLSDRQQNDRLVACDLNYGTTAEDKGI